MANWTTTKDNRDLQAAFDYGFNVEKALCWNYMPESAKCGVLCGLAMDTAWCLATNKQAVLITDIDALLTELTPPVSPHEIDFTPAELLVTDLARALIKLVHGLDTMQKMVPQGFYAVSDESVTAGFRLQSKILCLVV